MSMSAVRLITPSRSAHGVISSPALAAVANATNSQAEDMPSAIVVPTDSNIETNDNRMILFICII